MDRTLLQSVADGYHLFISRSMRCLLRSLLNCYKHQSDCFASVVEERDKLFNQLGKVNNDYDTVVLSLDKQADEIARLKNELEVTTTQLTHALDQLDRIRVILMETKP